MNAGHLTVAHHIVQALKRHKVECFFGQSLPSALVLAAEANGIRQITYRQENAGGAMADGYARVSGKVGIVLAQNGPAATLLVAPLAEAFKASIPLIAIIQEVERPQVNRNAFQELDHIGLFQSCAKYVRRIDDAARVDDYIDAAFVAVSSGRPGPAVLLLPADLLREPAVPAQFPRHMSYGHWPMDRVRPANEALLVAARMLANASAPIVMAGGGVLSSGAQAALAAFSEKYSLPVFTTNMGKGAVDEAHPLACGVLASLTGPRSLGMATRALHDEADVMLLIGSRTNQNGTDGWRLLPRKAQVIHIDVDPNEIGRNFEATRLVGDARETLLALHEAMGACQLAPRAESRSVLEARIAQAWQSFETSRREVYRSNAAPIRPERVMAELQQLLTADTTVVADASYSSMWVVGQLRNHSAGSRFLTPRGLAGLGWGVPMAMGVAIARPGKPVVALAGDGGFGHNWSELETMVRHGIPVVCIILNNGVLGFQKDAETVKFGTYTSACHFSAVDHAAIARSCGCDAVRVKQPGDIAAALKMALSSGKPWLIEVMTDPDAHPALSLFAGTLDPV